MEGLDDDYDPLAPVYVDDAEEIDEADGGIGDPNRIVRVWVEDDGTLTRIQLSPIWHRKLGHRTLSDVFAGVLAAARVRVAPPPEPSSPDTSHVDFSGLPRFGRDPMRTFQLALDNLNRRWQEAALRQRDSQPQPVAPPEVTDNEDITVRLDEQGQLIHVDFDDDWLDHADVREITDGVLALYRKARAEFRAAEPARDELADIALEHEILMAGFRAMLTGRGRR